MSGAVTWIHRTSTARERDHIRTITPILNNSIKYVSLIALNPECMIWFDAVLQSGQLSHEGTQPTHNPKHPHTHLWVIDSYGTILIIPPPEC